ncbi:DNA-binding domain-containing protein [Paraburkholderia sp. C35]|uniref:HvfC/BufC N-terminal domain-containing protein n=1 Tax=Paraburkholderia sp. C35 TaxID=2126993 RepID=UPI001EF5ABD1|nr:DNA-binding domain-containing protein [Paraburkholderia sp. C35]
MSPYSHSLSERQRCFASALLDPTRPVPSGLIGPDQRTDDKRFNVYRNNVVAGLVNTLQAAFPAVHRIVGEEFFAAMARIYVALEPPKSPVMLDYGKTFPDFIERFEPARSVPYLRDVARLERAWAEAYHADEASPVSHALLVDMASHHLPHLRLTLHPSARVVQSCFPIVQIWQMNIDGGPPMGIDIAAGGEDALVLRAHAEVEVRTLPVGAAAFIRGLAVGNSMEGATTLALAVHAAFDLAGALRDLFSIGAIVGLKTRAADSAHLRGIDESA